MQGCDREQRIFGEVRHFQAIFSSDPARKRELHLAAAAAYEAGCRLFSTDVRILLRLARAFDNLGAIHAAERYLLIAFAADPNLHNVYAHYGFHLWPQRKLARAEACYTKALSLSKNEIAIAGLDDIRRLREAAADPEYVELYGNPLENFDFESLGDDDERRGVRLDE